MTETGETIESAASHRLVMRMARDFLVRDVGWIMVAVLSMFAVSATTAAVAWLMKPAINEVFAGRDPAALSWLALAFPAVFVAKGFANYTQRTVMNFVGLRVVSRCRERLYDHLQGMDIGFFAARQTSTLVSRFTVDLTQLKNTVTSLTTSIGRDVVTFFGLVGSLLALDVELSLIALVIFPLSIGPVVLLGRKVRRASTGLQEESGYLDGLLLEIFQGIRMVKVYNAEGYERARVDRRIDTMHGHQMRQERVRAQIGMVLELLAGVAFAAVVVYGGRRVTGGDLDPGTFFAFITALFLMYQPIKRLGHFNAFLQEGLAAVERLYGVLDTPPALREAPDAATLAVQGGEIRFEEVTLRYDAEGAPALSGLDLRVPAGSTTALVGRSGAGKTTALTLIPRFRDPDSGRVLIDGQDVREVTFRSLWGAIGMVTQEVLLFDDTIRANIAYGKPDATPAEIEGAARAAAAHDFILALPDGYDTVVGEQGIRLSGGQRQRVVIAREMLKNAPILLLDEATSALDTESERQVRQAFDALSEGRTVVVVAHRLSTVVNADQIVVLDAGRVAEQGTHAELIAHGGIYADLCRTDLAER